MRLATTVGRLLQTWKTIVFQNTFLFTVQKLVKVKAWFKWFPLCCACLGGPVINAQHFTAIRFWNGAWAWHAKLVFVDCCVMGCMFVGTRVDGGPDPTIFERESETQVSPTHFCTNSTVGNLAKIGLVDPNSRTVFSCRNYFIFTANVGQNMITN